MIKFETVGMGIISKNNPVVTSENDVKNHSFMTVDGILYLVDNIIAGDEAYMKDAVIPAGEFLRCFQVDAHVGQKLVIDNKHIAEDVKDLAIGDVLVVSGEGVAKGEASGIHFVVTDKTTLTEAAVKARIAVA